MRRAAPGVVSVFSSVVVSQRHPLGVKDPQTQHRYGQLGPDAERPEARHGLGSGVILSADGLVLTNRHVVKDANRIQVELADGKRLAVRVVGFDPETDLAVLRADARDLPTIPIGEPKDLRVGDVVLAIGNPFGVGQTVTLGIVSATSHTDLGLSGVENFIQTDAAINPGNSGGALIDSRGALVGINTAIYSESGISEGVGFAIPADLAQGVARQVLASGKVTRGWLGISGRSVTPSLAANFGLRTESGVLISSTAEGSPAERARATPRGRHHRVQRETGHRHPTALRSHHRRRSRGPRGLGSRGSERVEDKCHHRDPATGRYGRRTCGRRTIRPRRSRQGLVGCQPGIMRPPIHPPGSQAHP